MQEAEDCRTFRGAFQTHRKACYVGSRYSRRVTPCKQGEPLVSLTHRLWANFDTHFPTISTPPKFPFISHHDTKKTISPQAEGHKAETDPSHYARAPRSFSSPSLYTISNMRYRNIRHTIKQQPKRHKSFTSTTISGQKIKQRTTPFFPPTTPRNRQATRYTTLQSHQLRTAEYCAGCPLHVCCRALAGLTSVIRALDYLVVLKLECATTAEGCGWGVRLSM